jgi:dienelactone hydrolase
MLVAVLVPAALAAGPHPVGWSDRSFDDPIAGRVATRVYYPALQAGEGVAADRAAGPFPLAVFLHGWLGQAWMYDGVCEELASHGFVVTSLDTETGLVLDMRAYADDAVAALHEVEARSADAADPLAGLVDGGEWTALGHSMGGGTLGLVLGLEPRVRTAVAFMPYEGLADAYDGMRAFDGSLLVLSGTADTTAPPRMQQDWIGAADSTARGLLVELDGFGHSGVTDLSWDEDPVPDEVQHELQVALAMSFVLAEHGGDEALWADLLTDPDGIGVRRWSRSLDPVLWATLDGDRIALGVVGPDASAAEITVGTGPAEEGLLDAVSVATLDLPSGVAVTTIDVPADHAGDLWVTARTDDGAWTRAIPLVTGSEPPQTTGVEPGPTPGDEPAVAAAPTLSGGCATVPGATVLWAWIGGLLARRRRG